MQQDRATLPFGKPNTIRSSINYTTRKRICEFRQNAQADTKLVTLEITYRSSRVGETVIPKQKARCSLIGNRLLPTIHYNPEEAITYYVDKAVSRWMLTISTAENRCLQHFYLHSEFTAELCDATKTVYVKEMRKFGGTYSHSNKTIGKLLAIYMNQKLQATPTITASLSTSQRTIYKQTKQILSCSYANVAIY